MDLNLGKILDTTATRDAVHVAIAPVVAGTTLTPGSHVGWQAPGTVAVNAKPIGIVDPFLTSNVKKGQRFYLWLYPNTVTSLRHVWTHPAFQTAEEARDEAQLIDNLTGTSRAWMTECATELEMSLDELLAAAEHYVLTGEEHCLGISTPDIFYNSDSLAEFWANYEKLTGKKVHDDNKQSSIFRCAC